jgi:flagellar hook-associated protein 2
VTSSSNTLTNVVEGLTLTLKATTTSAAQISVSKDTAAMRSAVDEFVKSYNAINTYLRDQTRYDATTKVAGKLQGDSAARSLQNQMRSLTQMTSGAAAGFSTLSSLGLSVQRDGSLLLDSSRFNAALANPSAVATAFTNDDVGESNDGFAVRINALTTALTGTDGLIESRTEGLRAAIRRQDDQITRLEDRVARTEERLMRQYSALDTRLGSLTGLGNYVSQQVTAWNNAKG